MSQFQEAKKTSGVIEGSVGEEYYPISQEILASFPKFRPIVDLYMFNEKILSLYPVAKKEERLSNEKLEKIHEACKEGCLFVSRSDHHIYVELLAKQAEFVLIDPNLHDTEIRDILIKALSTRLTALFEQPLPLVYKALHADIMVLTEYLWEDTTRIKLFMNALYTGEDNVTMHSLNVLFVGLWLYLQTEEKPTRKVFDRVAAGLALHDIGYSKVPVFILQKKTPLSKEENEKVMTHPKTGLAIAHKLEVIYDESNQIIFQHHELLDGKGYPSKLSSQNLSNFGMLGSVADTFSLMITKRARIQRVPTGKAAMLLAKDPKYFQKYTNPLAKAFMDGTFQNV